MATVNTAHTRFRDGTHSDEGRRRDRYPYAVISAARGFSLVVWRAARNFIDHEGLQWSGAVAFYLVLSVPPLLVAAFSVGVVIVGEEAAREFLSSQVRTLVPAQEDVVRQLVGRTINSTSTAIPISVAFLLFSGSRVFASLVTVIHGMWHDVPEAGFLRRQLMRVVLLLTTGMVFALAGAADLAVALLRDIVPDLIAAIVQTHVLPTALIAAGLLTVFKLIPRRRATWQSALVGAVFGAALLRVAQAVFTTYLSTLANFESAYGPIAGAAVLMTWALVASAVVLFAAHLVAILNGADSARTKGNRQSLPGDERTRERVEDGEAGPFQGTEPHEVAEVTNARSSSRTTK